MYNFNKKIIAIFLCLLCATFIFARGKKDSSVPVSSEKTEEIVETEVENVESSDVLDTEIVIEEEKADDSILVRVASLNGPSGISMAYLFENPPVLDAATISFEKTATPDILLPKLLKGEIDIGILPPNVAAKVYAKSKNSIVIGAVVGNGMLNLITRDENIVSLSDLIGKTVYIAGQGATPEYMFKYILQKNGIKVAENETERSEDAVYLNYSIPTSDIAAALLAGNIDYAVVPEPFSTVATSKDKNVRRAINLQDEYVAIEAAEGKFDYPMTVVVIRTEFAKTYPQLVQQFLDAYEVAIDWTNANPTKAGVLVQKHTLGLLAPIAARVIPNGAFIYKSAIDSRHELEKLFNIFMSFAPESIGEELPDDDFYFTYFVE